MMNSLIWIVYITLCFILLCFIYPCNGTNRLEITPLDFTYTIHCSGDRKNCNGNEPTTSACKPVFGFLPYYDSLDINDCTPSPSDSDKYCPSCKYTNPLTDLHSDVSKELSPLIFHNLTKMPVALYTLITHGEETIPERCYEQCINFIDFTTATGLDITRNINDSCYSLDLRISISCEEFYYGDKCDIECHPSKDNSTKHFVCDANGVRICGPGWRGQNCTEVDYCSQNPCENNGTCHNNNSYYECNCTQEFKGQNCSEIAFTTESITTEEVPEVDSSSAFQVTSTVPIEKSTALIHSEVPGNQQPTTTTKNIQNSFSSSTDQSTETGTSADIGNSTEISTMSFEPSSTGCINQHCSEESTVPTKKVTYVVSPKKSTEQARNKALPTTTVAIAGASGGGVILIAVIAVVCIIRLRKRNRELKKKFEREIKETDSNSFLRNNPIYGISFPAAPNTKEYKKEGEKKEDKNEEEKKEYNKEGEKKLESTVGNGYTSYL